jgi:outer membrane PBP1 activator LpoA protein
MEHQEKIEKYIQGKLTPDQQLAFEKELASDSQLAELLADYRKSEMAIKAAARQQLREAVQTAYDNEDKHLHRRMIMRRSIAIAAGFALLLAAGFWLLNSDAGKNNTEELFAQYFEMPASPSVRGGNGQTNTKWQQAVDFYEKQEFQSAIPLFQELLLDGAFDQKESVKLLLGAALLSEDQPNEALEIFDQISPESSFNEDAEWYRVLALLKANRLEETKKALKNIIQQKNHFKKEDATRILEQW